MLLDMILEDEVYKIGYISKTHGLNGEVNFHFTDDIFDLIESPYLLIRIDGIIVPLYLESYRFRSDEIAIVKFEGFNNAKKSQRLAGCDVLFERSKTTESESEELSLDYFVGFTLVDSPNNIVGKIIDVDTSTENYLFIVEDKNGNEVLIPVHDELIVEINHQSHKLIMSLPQGLLMGDL